MDSAWFGVGANLKQCGLEQALTFHSELIIIKLLKIHKKLFHFPLEAFFFIPTKVTSKYFVIVLD